MSKSYSIDEVMYLDHLLQQLATYDVFRGKIMIPKSAEESFELHKKTAERFNYFKDLIQRGECTVDFIKQTVLSKNGPFPQSKFNPDCLMEKIEDSKYDSATLEKKLIDKLLQKFDPSLTEEEVAMIFNSQVKPTKPTKKSRKKK